MKILMVITSHNQLGNPGKKTGFWLEELAAPSSRDIQEFVNKKLVRIVSIDAPA